MSALPVTSKALAPESWQEPGREVLSLIEGLAAEMTQRWQQGECPLVEEFFARHPELYHHPETALELIAEELALRQETGIGVDLVELQQRFPQWRHEVAILARCHHLLAGVRLPAVGERLGEFRLLDVLGRGALGQVYLAAQPSLAGRPVVLKLSPDCSGEHLSLARLQHSHIVPLISVHEFPTQGLFGLCLPYLGGTTLATLLAGLSDRPPAQRTGADLLAALRQVQAAAQAHLPIGGPACRFLEKASYVQAVCWIGMCLAEALQYAHERDLVHLDVKPSNVLLAADGQPMLLDFHLARAPLPAGASPPAILGGTPSYMAPEHQAAFEAVRERRAIPNRVDGRADVSALAQVMVVALGGTLPAPSDPATALRAHNPQVTASLSGLLAKCLASEPHQRYQTAGDLAADLRRYLSDLPLREVTNGTISERWRRCRRRHPYALPLLGLIVVVMTGAVLLCGHAERQSERAEAAWRQGNQYLIAGRPAEALENFRHGAALIEDLPMNWRLRQRLQDGRQRVECVQAAAELHQSCETMRALYGCLPTPAQGRAVESMCARLWQNRGRILQGLGQMPTAELEEQVRDDLLDVAILWSDLHVRQAIAGDEFQAREEALEVLAQAEAQFGPSCVLWAERQALGGPGQEEPILTPHNAWENYALGRLYLRTGKTDRAAATIDHALASQPQSLWANFYRGRCAFQTGAYEDAVLAFSVCVALTPTSAWAVYHRGLAYLEQERLDRAATDFDRAVRLDPTMVAAILGRGIVYFRQQRHAEAQADLRRVLDLEPAHEQARKLLTQLDTRP